MHLGTIHVLFAVAAVVIFPLGLHWVNDLPVRPWQLRPGAPSTLVWLIVMHAL